jgi:hypothetical protein
MIHDKIMMPFRSMNKVCLVLAALLISSGLVSDAAFMNQVEEVILESCKDYAILAGDTMDADCANYCGPNATETFDYADTDEHPDYVIRNSVCRCFGTGPRPEEGGGTTDGNAGGGGPPATNDMTFECWSKAEVWEKSTPIFKCFDKYNITSLSTCQQFCKSIDPIAFSFAGSAGSAKCTCSDNIQVCNDVI